MLDLRSLRHFDWRLLLIALGLSGMGILMVRSTTASPESGAAGGYLVRQLVWVILGLGVLFLALCFDYTALRRFERVTYLVALMLLVLVLLIGTGRGAQRWFALGTFQLNPGEFAKLLVLVSLAAYLARHRDQRGDVRVLLRSLGYVVPPAILVLIQPDMGSALTFGAIWVALAVVWGARGRHLLAFGAAAILVFAMGWYSGLVRDYQKERVLTLLGGGHRTGSAYQLEQSKIALGSGGVWGRGYGKGPQTRLNFIPAQHTDFIFTAVGEELGFVGAIIVLGLYLALVLKGMQIAAGAPEWFGGLLAVGVTSLFAFHVIVNVGMTAGLLPVTGLPLPFLSYGGSNLLVSMAAVGVLSGVQMRSRTIRF